MAYQNVYNVGLLDDIHNYFPDLLYNQERFVSVPDVLGYLRQNTITRFNLFDYGRNQHQNNTPPTTQPTVPPIPITPIQQIRRATRHLAQENMRNQLLEADLMELSTMFPFILPGMPRINRFQDVIVNASRELIDDASNVRTLLVDTDSLCSICQDHMRQGEQIRRLNICQHDFHDTCIDNWLLNNSVLCPVCRHDIREGLPVAATDSAVPPPPVVPPLHVHLNLNQLRPRDL